MTKREAKYCYCRVERRLSLANEAEDVFAFVPSPLSHLLNLTKTINLPFRVLSVGHGASEEGGGTVPGGENRELDRGRVRRDGRHQRLHRAGKVSLPPTEISFVNKSTGQTLPDLYERET